MAPLPHMRHLPVRRPALSGLLRFVQLPPTRSPSTHIGGADGPVPQNSPMLASTTSLPGIGRNPQLILPGGGSGSFSVWSKLDSGISREVSQTFQFGIQHRNLDTAIERFTTIVRSLF